MDKRKFYIQIFLLQLGYEIWPLVLTQWLAKYAKNEAFNSNANTGLRHFMGKLIVEG